MLTITQPSPDWLKIKANYYYMQRIKQLPTATFNPDDKTWMIRSAYIHDLEAQFEGELYYKTPRWVILNEPAPIMTDMYKLSMNVQVPSLKLPPFDYQNFGIKFMVEKILNEGFVINADDVGIGKTLQAIATIKWFIENRGAAKILIVCKKSIKSQWISEICKFTDLATTGFIIERTFDTPKKRSKAYDNIKNAQSGILITNYHNYLNDTDLIKDIGFDFVVVDEAHSISTRTGVINKSISKVCKGKPTAFLTGTPIMSKPEDIFGIAQIANPNYFGKWKDFHDRYIVESFSGMYTAIVGAKNLDELRDRVQNIVIRRTEYEVSVQLPEVRISKIECEKDNVQKQIIDAIAAKREELLNSYNQLINLYKSTSENKYMVQAEQVQAQGKALIAAAQAAATDPRMFLKSTSKMMQQQFGNLIPASYKMSNKTEATLDTIQEIMDNDEKVIIFTKFKTSAKMISDDIKTVLKQPTLMYTGEEGDDQREYSITTFLNSTDHNILIGTEAMAEGLNLQKAKFVINLDQPDTLAIKVQRIGRVRRVGSLFNNVIVYDMITKESKDTERLENIERNGNLEGALIAVNEAQRTALVQAMEGA